MSAQPTTSVPSPETPTPLSSAAKRLLAMLVFVYVLHMLDRQIISILLEPLRHEFKLNDGQLGALSGLAYSAAAVAVGVPAGMLADRFSRKKVLIGALVLWSGFTGACGLAANFPMLLVARMGVGGAESAAPPTCLSMITDAFPPHLRGRASTIFFASGGLGAVISFTAGAWIAANFGWRAAFLAAGVPGLLLALVLAARLKEPPRTASAQQAAAPLREGIGAIAASGTLATLIAAMVLASTGASSLGTWAASLLIREHGFDLRSAGLVLAFAAGIVGPAGQLLGGWIGDRLGARNPGLQLVYAAGAGFAGAAIATGGVMWGYTPVTVAAIWAGVFCMFGYIGPSYSLLMALAPPGPRATIMAIMTVLANLAAYGGGPVLVGVLSDWIGGPNSLSRAIPFALLAPVLSGLLFLVVARRLGAARGPGVQAPPRA